MATRQRRGLAAKRICEGRVRRRDEFPEDIFADIGWGMLMTIYVREHDGAAIDAAMLADETNTIPAVANRWLSFLREQKLVTIRGEDGDAEVRLTRAAVERLDRYLDKVIVLTESPVG